MEGDSGYDKRVEMVLVEVPAGIHRKMLAIVAEAGMWAGHADFIREAILEKVTRWEKENPGRLMGKPKG